MDEEADNQRPSGFEIVFPAMLNEAKSLCLDLPYELPSIKQIIEKREALNSDHDAFPSLIKLPFLNVIISSLTAEFSYLGD